MKSFLPPLIFVMTVASATAARLETSVNPSEVRVGDRFTFSVVLSTGAAEKPLPFAPPADIGPFELVRFASSTASCDFTLTTFEVGAATIPALTFNYWGADGKTRALRTSPVVVPVKSVLTPGDKDLKDIKGVLRLPPGKGWLWCLGALALAGLGVFAWRRWKRTGSILGIGAPAAPPIPPDAAALDALDRLEALIEGPSKPYYSRLVEIFRTYIEGRFGLSALDRTTTEMIPLLKELPLAAEERMDLRETLETADLAKFARFESPDEERRRHRDRVKTFVLSTRPRPAAEAPAP